MEVEARRRQLGGGRGGQAEAERATGRRPSKQPGRGRGFWGQQMPHTPPAPLPSVPRYRGCSNSAINSAILPYGALLHPTNSTNSAPARSFASRPDMLRLHSLTHAQACAKALEDDEANGRVERGIRGRVARPDVGGDNEGRQRGSRRLALTRRRVPRPWRRRGAGVRGCSGLLEVLAEDGGKQPWAGTNEESWLPAEALLLLGIGTYSCDLGLATTRCRDVLGRPHQATWLNRAWCGYKMGRPLGWRVSEE